MQNQPVVGVAAKFFWYTFFKFFFNLFDCFARRKTGAVADAEDMGVDGEGFLAPCDVHDDVGGLAAHAWEFDQLVAGAGNFSAIVVDQNF